MDQHLTAEQVQQIADGEMEMSDHAEQCGRCATAIVGAQELKKAVRDAMRTEPAPAVLRRRLVRRSAAPWWFAAAATVTIALLGVAFTMHMVSQHAWEEIVDMHITLLAGTNPIDVLSTDRHTVRPWFEGRVPFAVPVPDLASTPFRLIGGRVVFWNGRPAAYLLVGKGAHRISVFVFRDDEAPEVRNRTVRGISTVVWRQQGLTLVAVAEIPPADLEPLRAAFTGS